MRLRLAHVRRMPRRGPGRLAARGRDGRGALRGRGRRRVHARAQAVQGAHRRVRRHPGGDGPGGARGLHHPRRHRADQRGHRQPRGADGALLHHEAVLHRARPSRPRERHGCAGRCGHLGRPRQLPRQRLHGHAGRHHRGGREHHDALLPDHRPGPHALPPAHAQHHRGAAEHRQGGALPLRRAHGQVHQARGGQLRPLAHPRHRLPRVHGHALLPRVQGRRQAGVLP
mmetsp:Transcript_37341/g.94704  ORF Transcript_37341/g.94704 Transcript_37341/m.94704 type:complete len:228 (+) Transcript_37341:988-1671(+)